MGSDLSHIALRDIAQELRDHPWELALVPRSENQARSGAHARPRAIHHEEAGGHRASKKATAETTSVATAEAVAKPKR